MQLELILTRSAGEDKGSSLMPKTNPDNLRWTNETNFWREIDEEVESSRIISGAKFPGEKLQWLNHTISDSYRAGGN